MPRIPAARLAIAQIAMHWELEDNVRAMQRAMTVARAEGAALCAFAELALTGFHRRIVEWAQPSRVGPAVERIREHAAALHLAVAFGAPTFGADGERRNSHLFVDADGRLAGHVHKSGLTAPEATFFARGTGRPVLHVAGLACSAVICREVEDHDDVVAQLGGVPVDVLLWPGQMRPDPALPGDGDPPRHVRQAQALARRVGAWVVQTNWPNALNRPEESAGTGHSACIAPDGTLRFRLPVEGRGLGVCELGAEPPSWVPLET